MQLFDEYKSYVNKRATQEEKKIEKAQSSDVAADSENNSVGKISTVRGKTRVIKFPKE